MTSQLLVDLFQAYEDAKKNKKHSVSTMEFEINFEREIFKLYEELIAQKYEISQSICFISFYPIKREIFAGNFRDRIVHHLIFNYINPYCERLFIADSYSCRKGKGTSYGVKRADHFIRACSENYKKDCFILKLDISGYFMSINKKILYQKIQKILKKFEKEITFDKELILKLIQKIIFHDPTKKCIIKGKKSDWVGLPKSKSLFFARKDCGLPIGNLTSQLFGNVYLNDLDHFIKCKIKCKYYGRYVDDILIISCRKDYLIALIFILNKYLQRHLLLKLHQKKIYLQHFAKGVAFLGYVIKPHRINLKNKTKHNMWRRIDALRIFFEKNKKNKKKDIQKLVACLNAYMGILKKYSAHNLALKFLAKNLIFFPKLVFCNTEKNEKYIFKEKII